jgi:DnaJ-class molecular chaperone
MATKSRSKQIKSGLKNADSLCFLLTGKHFRDIAGKGFELFGDEIVNKASKLFNGSEEPKTAANSPYLVLGIFPDALDVVVTGSFRALVREYHPDTGSHPDTPKYQAVVEAYETIKSERKAKKAKECQPKS